MGNKASKAATAVSARTVLARRAAEQQSSAPGAPAAAASAGKQHQYQPEALPSGPQPDIDIDINPKLIDQISRMELIKTKIDKVCVLLILFLYVGILLLIAACHKPRSLPMVLTLRS